MLSLVIVLRWVTVRGNELLLAFPLWVGTLSTDYRKERTATQANSAAYLRLNGK